MIYFTVEASDIKFKPAGEDLRICQSDPDFHTAAMKLLAIMSSYDFAKRIDEFEFTVCMHAYETEPYVRFVALYSLYTMSYAKLKELAGSNLYTSFHSLKYGD